MGTGSGHEEAGVRGSLWSYGEEGPQSPEGGCGGQRTWASEATGILFLVRLHDCEESEAETKYHVNPQGPQLGLQPGVCALRAHHKAPAPWGWEAVGGL